MPLLHPADTLARGDVRGAAGLSANVALGAAASALKNAQAEAPTGGADPPTDATYARGALVSAAVAPGVAPFVAARVGVGSRFEAGLGYTGRGTRVDIRRAFGAGGEGNLAFSAGLGASAAFYGGPQGPLPGVDLGALRGYGLDVPLLAGWTSSGGIYSLWGGARGGYENAHIAPVTSEPRPAPGGIRSLAADRWSIGGVVGASTGFRHVHVAIELDLAYQTVGGTFGDTSVHVSGVTASPATALWWDF
jgi:hypothetical protein